MVKEEIEIPEDDWEYFEPAVQRDILTGQRKITGVGMAKANIWSGGFDLDE